MRELLPILIALLLGGIIIGYIVFNARYDVVLRFNKGKAKLLYGKLPRAFVDRIADYFEEQKLTGWILRRKKTNRTSLRFWGIAKEHHQRIRNLWHAE